MATTANPSSPFSIIAGVPFDYQFAAINSPTSWAVTGLPTGVSFNAATATISGTIAQPGVYSLQLTATNGAGTSAPLTVYLVVAASGEAASAALPLTWMASDLSLTDIQFDLRLRGVTSTYMTTGSALTFMQDDGCKLAVLLFTPAGQVSDATNLWLEARTMEDAFPTINVTTTGAAALTTITGGNYYLIPVDLTAPLITQGIDDLNAPSGGGPRTLVLSAQLAVQRGAQIARSQPFTINIIERVARAGAAADEP